MRVTYGHFNHIPFESSWAVLLKASALNLASPKKLVSEFARNQQSSHATQYWMARDVDDSKMASALSVPYPAIKRAFIDNLAECEPRTSQICIRHCSKCLAVGYHSVFFFLHMIRRCPWHNEPLEVCTHCSGVMERGLLFNHSQDAFSTRMRCNHFLFSSADTIRLNCVTTDQWCKYAELGFRIEKWLGAARGLQNPLINCATSLYDAAWVKSGGLSGAERLVNVSLNLAVSALGEFPAPNSITMSPIPPYKTITATYSSHEASAFDLSPSQIFSLYRRVRRYLYRSYVRPHVKCYKYLVGLSTCGRHTLDCQSACAVSSAFLVWCTALRYSFGEKGAINFVATNWHTRPVTPRHIMTLWITHFYAIWSGIESMCIRSNKDQDRFSVGRVGNTRLLVSGAEIISIIGDSEQLTSDLTFYYVCPVWLSGQAARRCRTRLRAEDQSNFHAWETVYFWAYAPDPSTFLRFWFGNHRKTAGYVSPLVSAG